jgi:25S rRNA (cytosine2278-C5)-methyltransferase
MYLQGKIIFQDKASCFPAVVLDPPAEDNCFVIDATAAPGNKTTHLSALMKNKGRVCQPTLSSHTDWLIGGMKLFAFEKDAKRFDTLKKMLLKAGCENTVPMNTDFLTTDPADTKFANVKYMYDFSSHLVYARF